ncbi:MAG: hypothetical protein RL167_898 [Actinomycetota bacterium]
MKEMRNNESSKIEQSATSSGDEIYVHDDIAKFSGKKKIAATAIGFGVASVFLGQVVGPALANMQIQQSARMSSEPARDQTPANIQTTDTSNPASVSVSSTDSIQTALDVPGQIATFAKAIAALTSLNAQPPLSASKSPTAPALSSNLSQPSIGLPADNLNQAEAVVWGNVSSATPSVGASGGNGANKESVGATKLSYESKSDRDDDNDGHEGRDGTYDADDDDDDDDDD